MAFPDEILSGLTLVTDQSLHWNVQESIETGAFAELLQSSDLTDHMKLPNSNQEAAKLTLLVTAARQFIEKKYSLVFMETAFVQTMDSVRRVIEMTRRPVLSITEIAVIPNLDIDTWVPVDPAIYTSSGASLAPGDNSPPYARVFTRSAWPASRGYQSFRVRYKAGWLPQGTGDAAAITAARAAVPSDLKQVILYMATSMYQGREGQLYNPDATQRDLLTIFRGLPPAVLEMMEAYEDFGL